MKWTPADGRSGDMVRIQIGSLYHYGVFVSEDEVIQFGYPPLPEFAGKNAVVTVGKVDVDAFSCGSIIEVADLDRREKKKRLPPDETVARARERLGEGGYNLIHNNCEHFVNEIVFGEKISEQELEVRRKWQRFHSDQ
jgi:hypothetical protein